MKKFCILNNKPVKDRPRIGRAVSYLCDNNWDGHIYSIAEEDKRPNLKPGSKKSCNIQVRKTRTCNNLYGIGTLIEILHQLIAVVKNYRDNWDVIIACHPFTLISGCAVKFLSNTKIVYYPPELYSGRPFWGTHWHTQACERIFKFFVDGIIHIQKDRKEIIESELKVDVPSVIIPNATYDYYKHLNKTKKREWSKPLTMLYQGTSHPERRCLPQLIDAVGRFRNDVVLKMALYPKEENIEKIKNMVHNTHNPGNFVFHQWMEYPNHFELSLHSHIGVMMYSNNGGINHKYCTPNKLYGYPMMGLPILASSQKVLQKTVEGNGIGVCVDQQSADAIYEAVRSLMDTGGLQRMGERARAWYLNNGKYDKYGEKLEKWLSKVAT